MSTVPGLTVTATTIPPVAPPVPSPTTGAGPGVPWVQAAKDRAFPDFPVPCPVGVSWQANVGPVP